MLMKRTTASVLFCTQVVLVHLQYISAKIHSKHASQLKIAKKSLKTPYFWGSRSFKVVDVGTHGKLLSSACYDTQQVLCLSATILVLD